MPDVYKQTTFEVLVLTVLAIIVLIISGGCIYAFVKAIFLFIFSHGEADKIKKAYSSIRYMIIGVMLTISFLFIFPPILKAIKLEGAENYTAKNVFGRIGELFNYVIGLGDIFKESKEYMKTNSNMYLEIENGSSNEINNYEL